mmetsp:Transcript_16616/g.42891  ORF Transcript_16616/g.42891 Transcript_16616/m.42891 type:complete len:113 (-) Transcript_16616:75-413(-)
MGKVDERTHDLMMRGGFRYDKKKDKYYAAGEATWDVEKRIQMGRRQLAVPATSLEEFAKEEEKMVDALLEKLKAKALKEGKNLKAAEDDKEEEAPKKKKQKLVEEEAEGEDE